MKLSTSIINSIFAFVWISSVDGMQNCVFPRTIINTGNIVPIEFINPQAKERTNDLIPRPIIDTMRIAPINFINPQMLNPMQTRNAYFSNFLNQQYTNREFVTGNNKLELVPSNSLNLYMNPSVSPNNFFASENSSIFLPNFSQPINQNILVPNLNFRENQLPNDLIPNHISQENEFPNTISINLNSQESSGNNIVWRAKKKVERSKKGIKLAFFSPTLPSNIFTKKSEEQKASVHYRKKNRREKYFDGLNVNMLMQNMALIDSRTKIERQVCVFCEMYDQNRDIDAFFNNLICLPLISVIRSQKWVVNKVLDIFESAGSIKYSSQFLKIFPRKPYQSEKSNTPTRNYNIFGYIIKLCSYESGIRAYNLYTPIIFEKQGELDVISALKTDNFAGKVTKISILEQIYSKALERQREGKIPDKMWMINNNYTEN